MRSILTVLDPASTQDLTVLQKLKDELGISGTTSDTLLGDYITRASDVVASITGRVYGLEEVRETFYFSPGERIATLKLARRPVVSVESLLENGGTLVEGTDFVVDAQKALLYRLNGTIWAFSANPAIVVEYTAGYELLDAVPFAIEHATLLLAKSYYHGADRDSSIRSETTVDLDSVTYRDALGAEQIVRDMLLGPYTELVIA